MNTATMIPAMLAPRSMPEPKAFLHELQLCLTDANWFQTLMRDNEELRTCWWAGQH